MRGACRAYEPHRPKAGEPLPVRGRIVNDPEQIVQESGRLKNKQAAAPCPYCEAGHMRVSFGKPKTASGEDRVIDLDEVTVGALLSHRLRQHAERESRGDAYADHGLVFAREDGKPLRPDDVTKLFGALVDATGPRHSSPAPGRRRRSGQQRAGVTTR
ncbi:hypothetical protein ACWD7Y_29175 [Streptomyces drozdowiczii]